MDIHALPDGRVIRIRPIRPDDGERLQVSHERLSEESRYRRFMSSKPTLSSSDVSYLVDIDGRDHYALVATSPGPKGDVIIGVARYIRLPAHPDCAEFAIVVGDAWQGHGIAGELLGRLADAAVTGGIRRFSATIFADNMPIRHMIEDLAAGPIIQIRQGNVLELEFPLPTRDEAMIASDDGDDGDERGAPAMIAACAGS